MIEKYKAYLKEWLNNDGGSLIPLSFDEWKKKYLASPPTQAEWNTLRDTYQRLIDISADIRSIRILLFNSRAHRCLIGDDKEFNRLDEILFRIQSEIWYDEENGFGAESLIECIPE